MSTKTYLEPGTTSKITARTVRARVADWVRRLEALYTQFDEWVEDVPHSEVRHPPAHSI